MSIKKLLRNQKGFSLIELLIVIGILAILAVIIIPRFADTGEDSRDAADASNARLIQSAVERYHFDTGKYPTSSDALPGSGTAAIDTTDLIDKYLSEAPKDPWNKSRTYAISDKGVVQLLGKPTTTTE